MSSILKQNNKSMNKTSYNVSFGDFSNNLRARPYIEKINT